MLKIGVANRDPNAYHGGDNIQINAMIKALEMKGVFCHQPLEFKPNWSNYDVVHAYHLNFSWSNIIYNNIWEQNKPYFITAIFYPSTDLGSSAEQMKAYVEGALFTVVQSDWEKQELIEITGATESKIRVIPNGVESSFIVYPPHYEINCEDKTRENVITVTAREGDKNSYLVQKVCAELNIPYVNISGFKLKREELPDIYRKSRVFVNASDSERMSLTTHEALASYCKVISTEFNRGNQWFPGLVTCNPSNYHDLKSKINFAYRATQWCYLPNDFAASLTWDIAAERYLECFRESQLEF